MEGTQYFLQCWEEIFPRQLVLTCPSSVLEGGDGIGPLGEKEQLISLIPSSAS